MRKLASLVAATGLLSFLSLAPAGCMSVKSYVDPKLPSVRYAELKVNSNPQGLQLDFQFQRNGKPNARATKQVEPKVTRILDATRLFASVSPNTCLNGARLEIVMNNVADMGNAVGKGVGTGLSLGLAGSLVTDNYVFTATYTASGKTPVTKVYHHALHTTVGNKKGPEGLEPLSINEAFDRVLDQLVLNLLKDLQQEGAL